MREKYWLSSILVFKGICNYVEIEGKWGEIMSVKCLILANLTKKKSIFPVIFCSGRNLEHVLCYIPCHVMFFILENSTNAYVRRISQLVHLVWCRMQLSFIAFRLLASVLHTMTG